jgi:hypothetical protein
MEIRAALILHTRATNDNHLERYLPIFDCTPDLRGRPARQLSPAETEAFLDRFDHQVALAP